MPARLARRSPLLARVVADGAYLRAILGTASLLGLLAGLALGVAALRDTGGDALPPAATLTIAIAVLGVLDATAGLVAVLIFTIGVLVLGGVDSNADLRLTLSLGALWFVVPVLAGAARPLRRPPARSLEESWDRAADFVIASLVGAWAVRGCFARGRGGSRIVVMLFVATAIGALLLRTMDEHAETFLADSFVILALPGFVLALLPVFGRARDAPATGWGKRIAGIAILVGRHPPGARAAVVIRRE